MKDMGSINRVSCECGFNTTVRVGGNRETYLKDSSFPFYCEKCGLVDVNIRESIKCPTCQSEDIHQYGKDPISRGKRKLNGLECGKYRAVREENLCPRCKNFTMKFDGVEIFFD